MPGGSNVEFPLGVFLNELVQGQRRPQDRPGSHSVLLRVPQDDLRPEPFAPLPTRGLTNSIGNLISHARRVRQGVDRASVLVSNSSRGLGPAPVCELIFDFNHSPIIPGPPEEVKPGNFQAPGLEIIVDLSRQRTDSIYRIKQDASLGGKSRANRV